MTCKYVHTWNDQFNTTVGRPCHTHQAPQLYVDASLVLITYATNGDDETSQPTGHERECGHAMQSENATKRTVGEARQSTLVWGVPQNCKTVRPKVPTILVANMNFDDLFTASFSR